MCNAEEYATIYLVLFAGSQYTPAEAGESSINICDNGEKWGEVQ